MSNNNNTHNIIYDKSRDLKNSNNYIMSKINSYIWVINSYIYIMGNAMRHWFYCFCICFFSNLFLIQNGKLLFPYTVLRLGGRRRCGFVIKRCIFFS